MRFPYRSDIFIHTAEEKKNEFSVGSYRDAGLGSELDSTHTNSNCSDLSNLNVISETEFMSKLK